MPNSLKSLLPCPHCGKSDFDEWPIMEAIGDDRRYIRCVWCLASAPEATWNTRAPIAEGGGVSALQLDMLREMLATYTQDGWTLERAALTAAIESLSRQGGGGTLVVGDMAYDD